MRLTGAKAAGSQETHSKASNLPTGPQDGPAAHMAASLRPHGSHPIRVAAWHLELLFGGPGRVETPRPGLEKLGAVRTDPDLIGLLFTLIYRATSHRQERAQTPGCLGATTAGKGLIHNRLGGQNSLCYLAARARARQRRMQLRDGVIRGCTKGLKVQSARRVKHVAREWRDNLELRACLGGRFI